MATPRLIGDSHVRDVCEELRCYYEAGRFAHISELSSATAEFITSSYPNATSIAGKFDFDNPDQHPDITITTASDGGVTVNLYKIKNNNQIQPKNLGAKSFLSRYFLSERLQDEFDEYFEYCYREYLIAIAQPHLDVHAESMSTTELKRLIKSKYSSFQEDIEVHRQQFLYRLREKCFSLFSHEYNDRTGAIEQAFNTLFMTDSFNVVTRYNKHGDLIGVEEFKANVADITTVSITKTGRNTVGVTASSITLLLRFKFESSPTSSVKLATSFTKAETATEVLSENESSLVIFEQKIKDRLNANYRERDQNAIGKCGESIMYYQLLANNVNVKQVDEKSFIEMFEMYSHKVANNIIEELIDAAKHTVPKLLHFLSTKHGEFTLDSIELVPENYIKNRLDTADLELILRVSQRYVIEPISLKAASKNTRSFVCKNPGVGQILGSTYFDLDQRRLSDLVSNSKSQYELSEINHRDALEIISNEIGNQLSAADQGQLKKGLKALLGNALVVIIFYETREHLIIEHDETIPTISVLQNHPSAIQNTLQIANKDEEVSIRVKFSANQNRGWSSVKLVGNYKYTL